MKHIFSIIAAIILSATSTSAQEAYVTESEDGKTLTFYYDTQKSARQDTVYEINAADTIPSWTKRIGQMLFSQTYTTVVFDTSFKNARPVSCAHWFNKFYALKEIKGIENLNTSEVTNMKMMFSECLNLTTLDLRNFNTSKVTDMSCMFAHCEKLNNLNTSVFKTNQVRDMSWMFWACLSLTDIDVSNFDTKNVTNMKAMFAGCNKLCELDVSHFNTENVVNMGSMFYGCQNIKSLDVSNFNTQKTVNMQQMFSEMTNITSIDLSSFDIRNVTDIAIIFYNCYRLKTIIVDPDRWILNDQLKQSSKHSAYIFYNCFNLFGGKGTEWFAERDNISFAHIDEGVNNPGLLTSKDNTPYKPSNEKTRPYAVLEGEVLYFKYDNHIPDNAVLIKRDQISWKNIFGDFTKVVFDKSFAKYAPKTTESWFHDCSELISIEGLNNLNTSEVTDMTNMFRGCKKLLSLDLSNFNTAKVKSMIGIFESCSSLTELDLSSFDTKEVTSTAVMFQNCIHLRTIYVDPQRWKLKDELINNSNWHSGQMFAGCMNLYGEKGTGCSQRNSDGGFAQIDKGPNNKGYLTTKGKTPYLPRCKDGVPFAIIENQTLTFKCAEEVPSTGIIINGWEQSWKDRFGEFNKVVFDKSFADCKPTTTKQWFYQCDKITQIVGIEYFNTSEVTDMSGMFANCCNLTDIDLSGFTTENVTDMSSMFAGCNNIMNLDLSNFNTQKVDNMAYLFSDCSSLTELDLSTFYVEMVGCTEGMFKNCTNLKTIFVNPENLVTYRLEFSENMFKNCHNLVGGKGTKFNPEKTGRDYARIDGGTSAPGYFTEKK